MFNFCFEFREGNMAGDVTMASCEELNTDPFRSLDYQLPTRLEKSIY